MSDQTVEVAVAPSLEELRAGAESTLLEQCRVFYKERLISLVVYGSVARGTFTLASDVDFLVVANSLPPGRIPRVREFDAVETALQPSLQECRRVGWNVELSPIFKTTSEAERGSPLFLDMIDDARILFDRDHFFANRLEKLRKRLRALGSRRIWSGNIWYWDLKPDYKPGDVIEL